MVNNINEDLKQNLETLANSYVSAKSDLERKTVKFKAKKYIWEAIIQVYDFYSAYFNQKVEQTRNQHKLDFRDGSK
jgi:hypothetical protein